MTGEVVVFGQGAGLCVLAAPGRFDLLERGLGDVFVEPSRVRAREEDPLDGAVVEGAVAQCVDQGAMDVGRRVALAQRDDLARVIDGGARLSLLETGEEIRCLVAERGKGRFEKLAVDASSSRHLPARKLGALPRSFAPKFVDRELA